MHNRIDQLASGISTPQPHRQAASDAAAPASNRLAALSKKVEEVIVTHPAISLGVALAMGATLGWFLKRK
jgi:hypothetical protein